MDFLELVMKQFCQKVATLSLFFELHKIKKHQFPNQCPQKCILLLSIST